MASLKTAIYSHLVGSYGVTFTAAVTDLITAAGHSVRNGMKLRVSSTTTLPAGLSANTNYFARDVSGSTFKVAASVGGAAVDITDTGTGTHSLGTALSDLVANRIYPRSDIPQNPTLPYVAYHVVSNYREPTLNGASGLARARVQFDIYANTALVTESIKEALRDMLDQYDLKDMGTGQLDVRLVSLDNESEDIISPSAGSGGMINNETVDYFFIYAESVPAH